MQEIPFCKLHGTKNSFVVLRTSTLGSLRDEPASLAREVAAVGTGLGSDGVMIIHDLNSAGAEIVVDMYNPDGSEMGMCGNGIRCVFRECIRSGIVPRGQKEAHFSVFGRRITCFSDDEGLHVRVDMGTVSWEPEAIPVKSAGAVVNAPLEISIDGTSYHLTISAVSMGNPHVVLFSHQDEFLTLGPFIEHHALFPRRTNVEFVRVCGPDHLEVKVWERGAGATLACGTGACASVVVAASLGFIEPRARVSLPGGDVFVEYERASQRVFLAGPTSHIATGHLLVGQ